MSTTSDHLNDVSNIKINSNNHNVNTTSSNDDYVNITKANTDKNTTNTAALLNPHEAKQHVRPVSDRKHSQKLSVSFSEAEVQVQHQVAQHQLSIHRQNSLRLSSYKKKQNNDLESRVNRMYSFLLVKYHWAILLFGLFTCLVLTGVGFVKQPLPNFLDPKKGFGARGEGTLTSKLIVMKNINKELIKYQSFILDTYEQVRIANRSDFTSVESDQPGSEYDFNNANYTYEDYEDYDDSDYGDYGDYEEYEDIWSNKGKSEVVEDKEYPNDGDEEYPNEEDNYKLNKKLKKKVRRQRRSATEVNSIEEASLGNEYRFLDDVLYKGLTGKQIMQLMPMEINFMNKSKVEIKQRPYSFKPIEHCEVSLGLNSNLEFYFHASDSIEVTDKKWLEKYEWPSENADKADEFYADIDTEYSIRSDSHFDFRHVTSDPDKIEDMKLQYIEDKVKNLLNLKNLKSLCQWNKRFLDMIAQASKANNLPDQAPCYFSLPDAIALLNGKASCMDVTATDVRHFLAVARQCYPLQKNGILFWAAEDSKKKSEMDSLLHKNDPVGKFMALGFVNQNVCFKNNLMHIVFEFLVDRNFMELDELKVAQNRGNQEMDEFSQRDYNIRTSSLLILNDKKIERNGTGDVVVNVNGERIFQSEFMFNFYLESLNKQVFDDEVTQLAGINLMGLREEAAMRLISQEMTLVALAILLIVSATLLYLKSVVISMMINLTVGLSIGVSFFAYRIVFDIELFPFLNMMAAFLLLGIACDDVFVLFDSWYNEKAKVIMEDLPEMIEKQYEAMNINPDEPLAMPTIHGSQVVNSPAVELEEYLLPPMFIERKFINSYNDDRDNRNRNKHDKKTTKLPAITENAEELNESNNFIHSNKTLSLRKNSEINIELQDASISLERLNDYMLNPGYIHAAVLTDEQLIRAMSGTLRHAASSIFVTSFTTAAAFFSNYITKLPYVQLFGFFTGCCILVKFIMVLTMVLSFVITFEKHINIWRCKLKPRFADKWELFFNRIMDKIALINYCIISKNLPKLLIRFRFVFFTLGVFFGVCGMVAVFYKPKLSPPSNWRYQFFADGNHFENFEFGMKDKFLSYVNEEKRNLTNPEVFFVFGIIGKDNGDIFDPDDDGYLVYDKHFDFLDQSSQIWLNDFINEKIASHPELFIGEQIVKEWNEYLISIQQLCWETLGLNAIDIFVPKIPYERAGLSKCREEIASFMQNSSVRNFESMMASFPRRIIFIAQGNEVTGILLRVNANRTFSSYEAVSEYFDSVHAFSENSIRTAPEGFNTGWFVSVGFALYDLQSQLISGTYSSLVFSMSVALLILLLTSGNVLISLLAIITISFSIADTIAIFVLLGWKLDILESVVIIMSVGLSVDFSCHYGVAYINADVHSLTDTTLSSIFESNMPNQKNNASNQMPTTDNNSELKALKPSEASTSMKSHNKLSSFFKRCKAQYRLADKERFVRLEEIFSSVGSAVLMASVTTFLAGSSMFPSGLISFSKMGQFLMLVMFFSYIYATFFFVPMCAIFGPTKNFGKLNLKKYFQRLFRRCCHRSNSNQSLGVVENGESASNDKHNMLKVKVPLTKVESSQSP